MSLTTLHVCVSSQIPPTAEDKTKFEFFTKASQKSQSFLFSHAHLPSIFHKTIYIQKVVLSSIFISISHKPKMEAYSSSSSSSTYLSQNFQETKSAKLPHPFNSSLHTVKKPPTKPWKKPVAPLPPTPPRIYKVDPINFRDLVQKLTGATEFQSQQRLQSVAPPPLNVANSTQPLMYNRNISVPPQLHHSTSKPPLSAVVFQDLTSREMKPQKISDSEEAAFSLGMSLSPSSLNWCSYPLMSPGTLSSLEQSTVLQLALFFTQTLCMYIYIYIYQCHSTALIYKAVWFYFPLFFLQCINYNFDHNLFLLSCIG